MDELVSFLLSRDVRGAIVSTTHLSRHARGLTTAAPASAVLLSQWLTASLLIASLDKKRGRINLQLECDGPIGGLFADATGEHVRGFVRNPEVSVIGGDPAFRWRPALGNRGELSVLRDLGGGEIYRSTVQLQAMEPTRDLEHYFERSEQLPTALALLTEPIVAAGSGPDDRPDGAGVERLGRCLGLMVQPLPGSDAEGFAAHAEAARALTERIPPVDPLEPESLVGVAERLFGNSIEVLERYPVTYRCECSEARVLTSLRVMGAAEVREILETEGKAEATCHFCSASYTVGADALRTLLRELETEPS